MCSRGTRVCALLLMTGAGFSALAQLPETPNWMRQGYHYTKPDLTPRPPEGTRAEDILAQLADIQNTTLAILRKSNFSGDWDIALGAAMEARANAGMMALVGSNVAQAGMPEAKTAAATFYLLAFKNETVQVAQAYWMQDNTLHYIDRQGKKAQAPLASLDVPFTMELNRQRNVEFRLPPK